MIDDRPHVLFAWEWGTGRGHLVRFNPLLQRLVSRGCRVTAIVRNPSAAGQILRPFEPTETNAAFDEDVSHLLQIRPIAVSPPTGQRLPSQPTTFGELAWNLGFSRPDYILESLGWWRHQIHRLPIDAVITDFGLAAALAAIGSRLPVLRIGPVWD